MLYHNFKLLNNAELLTMARELMKSPDWIDGALSATGKAREVKRNLQLNNQTDTYIELSARISDLLLSDIPSLAIHVFPKKIINILFSRTSTGMYYGKHIDAAHTPEGRRDYSFTLFLNNPADYEGGELVLDVEPEKRTIKLDAGSIVIYPTKYLHEVKEVTKGERLVCVGWIESYIKNDEEREILANIREALILNDNNKFENSFAILSKGYQRLKKYFGN